MDPRLQPLNRSLGSTVLDHGAQGHGLPTTAVQARVRISRAEAPLDTIPLIHYMTGLQALDMGITYPLTTQARKHILYEWPSPKA